MASSELFSRFYEDYAQAIYAFLYYRTRSKAVAEDLTSQTFLKALEKFERFDQSKGGFKPWIYQIARNTLIDHYRSSKPLRDLETAYEVAGEDDVEETIKRGENAERVQKALGSLNEKQRELVILRVWDELTFKEIGALLGKTEASIKMTFYRALQDVEKQLALLSMLLAYFFSNSLTPFIYG